ncbi:hypothetical protein DVH24_015488 [Malus domestica]|uniref:Uncharacterized protein n=1 Tax=Malus domestica TaxID=3750 RepID=A0A498HHB4_MALDO|nr:hypothetical protein DVH24_015488 [Malus domestica]
MHQKFNDAQLAGFRASCFGHLKSVDRLALTGQLVQELLLYRVANQGVKDLEGLTHQGKGRKGKGQVKIVPTKGSQKVFVTCVKLEKDFFKDFKKMRK